MGSMQGRILQSHVTNNGLVIRKTKLHSFQTLQDLKQSTDLFSRYMASDRVGDTRQFVSFDVESLPKMPVPTSEITASKSEIIASASENVAPSSRQDIGEG